MAITWAAQTLGLAYVMIFQTEKAPAVLDGMEDLSTIWAVGLSVLGIYVYKRSEEKKVVAAPACVKSEAATAQITKTTNLAPSHAALSPKVND